MEAPKTPTGRKKRPPTKAVAKHVPQDSELQTKREEKTQGETFKQTIYPYITTGEQIAALARKRRREKESELYRDAVDIGCLFLSVEGEPDPGGLYGTLSVEDLARRIRPKVIVALDWLAQHGHPVQTGSATNGLEALLSVFQQGMIPATPKTVSPSPSVAAVQLEELPDLVLSDQLELTLSVDEDGFL
jgi:hypothetical protein